MMESKKAAQIALPSLVPGFALLGILIFVGLGSAASAFAQQTFYVSKSAGSDSNTAKSKSTSWAHLPGMASCTSNCGSYSPVAGDTFILMGCDVWVNSDLPVNWNWSGSNGNPITITVDKTWYNASNCSSNWNRPVFDGQNQTSPSNFFTLGPSSTVSYVVVDNIEMKRGAANSLRYLNCGEPCANDTYQNMYLHAWGVVTDGSCYLASLYGAGNTVQTSVIDGSDRTGDSPAGGTCYAFYPSLPNIKNNIIHDVANGIVGRPNPGPATISGNNIYNIILSNSGSHANAVESVGADTWYFYNNVIHDFQGEAFFFGGSGSNGIQYVWNNIWYNSEGGSLPEGDGGSGGFQFYAWNNTVVSAKGGTCFGYSKDAAFAAAVIENNHCISTGNVTSASWGGLTPTQNNNVLMSPATAAEQGYTSSENYAYSPTASTNGTVGAGKTICGVEQTCTGNFAALANDTQYACTQQTVNGVVQAVCPARTGVPRPGDAGAFQYVAGGSPPNPPTGLTAVVQ
jgi:hypothetical protein